MRRFNDGTFAADTVNSLNESRIALADRVGRVKDSGPAGRANAAVIAASTPARIEIGTRYHTI